MDMERSEYELLAEQIMGHKKESDGKYHGLMKWCEKCCKNTPHTGIEKRWTCERCGKSL